MGDAVRRHSRLPCGGRFRNDCDEEQPNTIFSEDGSPWSRTDRWVIVIPP